MTEVAERVGTRATSVRHRPKKSRGRRFVDEVRSQYLLYLMVLPGLVYFGVFKYGPMYGAIIAFKDFRAADGIIGSQWAGWANFQQVFDSPYFTNILTNTLLISVYKIAFGTPAAILLALLLNEVRVRWFKRTVQTITYLPHFLSWVVVFGIALSVLSPQDGLANQALRSLGANPIDFFTSTDWFRTVIVASDVWKNVGWNAIIYLAALAGISPSLYEAGAVDGANRLRLIWHITLPGLIPVIVLVTVLNIGQLLSAGFEQVYVFYNPSVYSVGDIIDTWVYRQGIQGFQYSVASAVGLFKGVVGCVLLIAANWAAKRWAKSGIW